MNPRRLNLRRAQRGMTLIELMVGMTIGLVLVAGLALLFGRTSQSSNELEKALRQIENGRYAVDLLAEDLGMAGYFGEAVASGTEPTVGPCSPSAAVVADLEAKRAAATPLLPDGIQGLTPDEAAALPCLADHLAGTPAVVVRRLDPAGIAADAIVPGEVYVQSSNSLDDLNATYIAGTATGDFVLRDLDGTTNKVRRYLTRIYYVANCSDCGIDTIPTLKRAELREDAMVVSPLAEGIQHLNFDYGFDTNGDAVPDSWYGLGGGAAAAEATAAAALGWGNVVAVRIHVLSRGTEPSPGFTDTRTYASGLQGTATFVLGAFDDAIKRRAYVTTTRLHSVAGLRE